MPVTTVTITGTVVTPGNTALEGKRVTFRLLAPLRDGDDNVLVAARRWAATLDATGALADDNGDPFTLIPDDLTGTAVGYEVTEQWRGGETYTTSISVADAPSIDYLDLPRVVTPAAPVSFLATAQALADETASRESADTALDVRLDVLEADPTTQTALEQETARAEGVEASLIPLTQKGAVGGVATLDGAGTVPDAQIPSTIARDAETATAVANAVAALVNSAPGTLDTLGEIATALQADESAAAALTTTVAGKENVVVHGSTASTARPSGATVVHWIGSVAPTNAATNDEWSDTANKLVKRWTGTVWDSFGSATYVALGSVQVDVTNNPIANIVCDAVEVGGCSVAAGSNVINAAPGSFPASAVGKAIAVGGAGAAGAALTTSPSGALRTIIAVAADGSTATFDDPTHVVATTAVVAARSVTAATVRGNPQITAADGAFTNSDIGKTISIPGAYGDDCPSYISPSATIAIGTPTTLASDYACFTTAHVGQYVRVSRAAGSGQPLIAKIQSRTSSTQVTLDTPATVGVTGARIALLGTPRTLATTITKVDSPTQIEVRRVPDFTVAATASAVSGGFVVYGTDNGAALDALIAAVPDYTTLFFPGFALIGINTHTISRPLTFTAPSRNGGGIHVGATSGRLVPGASYVTFRHYGVRALQQVLGETDLFGNAAANSAFTDWTFDHVKSVGACLQFTRQGRTSNTGTVTSTGVGISQNLRLLDVDVSAVMGNGVTIDGVNTVDLDVTVHDLGRDTTSVGCKLSSGAKNIRGRIKAYLCSGDGVDGFDSQGADLDVLSFMNGQHGLDVKWNSNANYNAPDAPRVKATCNFNWSQGLGASTNRVILIAPQLFGNANYGGLLADGATGTTDPAQYGRVIGGEASDNGSAGWEMSGAKRWTLDTPLANNNGGYGIYNGSAENTLIDPRAFNNNSSGVFHDTTATLVKQIAGRTQDANGQYVAASGATFRIDIGDFISAVRTADATPVNASTTLVTDSVLTTQSLPVGTYEVTVFLIYDSSTTADLKLGLSLPAGASGDWGATAIAAAQTSSTATVPFLKAAVSSTLPIGGAGVGTLTYAELKGTLVLTQAGVVALQYAQNTSDATNTTVRANSRLRLLRVA